MSSDSEILTIPSVAIDRLFFKKVLSFKLSAAFLISISEGKASTMNGDSY